MTFERRCFGLDGAPWAVISTLYLTSVLITWIFAPDFWWPGYRMQTTLLLMIPAAGAVIGGNIGKKLSRVIAGLCVGYMLPWVAAVAWLEIDYAMIANTY